MRTEQELIAEAIAVQNACNLSGIVGSFADALYELWSIADKQTRGTDWVNQHRVSRLYASKILSLAGDVQPCDFGTEDTNHDN
jgi:hypothetical protein